MKSLNFDYLRQDWPELAELGGFGEHYAHSDPMSALAKLRGFAERLVEYLYHLHGLTKPYPPNLIDPLNEYTFRQAVPEVILAKLHRLRIRGNKAAHGDKMNAVAACEISCSRLRQTGYCLRSCGDSSGRTPPSSSRSSFGRSLVTRGSARSLASARRERAGP